MVAEYERPHLYPKQLAAIFCPERYAIVEASTKSGKTAGCMVWLTEQAMSGKPGQHFWWVAPVYSQAKIVYTRLKRALPRALYTKNESDLSITLANEAVIWFKGADNPDSLYGDDVYAAVIDEASRCKEDAFHAVRSTLTHTAGPLRIIGNVKGRRNWAYLLARQAEAGAKDMHYAKIRAIDAVEAGIIPAAEVEDAKRVLPAAVYRELYEAEPSDDEGNPFGISAIDACVARGLSTDHVVAWGWDLAKSHDWTVGVGLDGDGYVARFERFQQPWEETVRNIVALTDAPALVDSTGVGDPVLEQLQKKSPNRFEGFKFTSPSKQQLMEGLAVAIQHRQVRFPAGPLVDELKAFEYVYTRTGVKYSAPEGLFDDAVCALALAVRKAARRGAVMPAGLMDIGADAHTELSMGMVL
jgi:Terminase RNaseH-like domain